MAGGAAKAAKGAGSLGSKLTLLGTAAAAWDQAKKVANPKDNLLTSLQQLGRSVSKATGDKTAPGGRHGYRQSGGTSTGAKPANAAKAKPAIPASRDLMNSGSSDKRFEKPKASDPARTRSTGSSGSSTSSGSSSPRSLPRPSLRAAMASSDAGMKNQDKNYRGNLFEKTFGYKPGQAPDQTKTAKNFDTKSDLYSPSTKVDGSKLDAKKIDQKKVNEYGRRKRRYND
jgi:hypothetical protein